MSKILAEQLLAGIILADNDNREYIYLPGGEVGSEDPHCIFEKTVSAPVTCRLKKQWNLPNACTYLRGAIRSLAHGRGEKCCLRKTSSAAARLYILLKTF